MIFKKILNFIDENFSFEEKKLKLGKLYKIKGEELPFRYIQYSHLKNKNNKSFHFKHHQLKEYVFKNTDNIQREANPEEIRIYNLIKDHVNEINNKTTYINYN